MSEDAVRMPLIGDRAPEFTAKTPQSGIHFSEQLRGKLGDVLLPPGGFRPRLHDRVYNICLDAKKFARRSCELPGLSIDSLCAHIAWRHTIKEKIHYRGMKDIEVAFPVIEDLSMRAGDPLLPVVQRAQHG